MTVSPYLRVWARQLRNRLAAGDLSAWFSTFGPVLVGVAAVPVVAPWGARWATVGPAAVEEGVGGIVFRLGLLQTSLLALDLYDRLVRGPDRTVQELLPVRPGPLAVAALVAAAVERGGWWLAGCLVLAALAPADPALALGAGALLTSCFLLGLVVGAGVHLLAVDLAAQAERYPWLDLVRGNNPRAQAAFLYAPAAALGLTGLALGLGVGALPGAARGEGLAVAALLAPAALAGLLLPPLRRAAERSWVFGTRVLGEIDARYARLESPAEATAVYLDWSVRFFPSSLRRYLLLDLRAGWRAHRGALTGTWLLGLLAAGLAGRSGEVAVWSGWVVGGLAIAAAVGVGPTLDAEEDPFLRKWLPRPARARLARAMVLAAWSAPGVALPWLAQLLWGQSAGSVLVGLLTWQLGLVLWAALLPGGGPRSWWYWASGGLLLAVLLALTQVEGGAG